MDKLRSLVPQQLLERIQTGRSDAPLEVRFAGSVLFADIADYTDLAEQLCERGPDGVERLAQFLNGAFERYIRCVHAAGGEVACFAGDALVAYWAANDGGAAALHGARECARLLHSSSIVDLPEQCTRSTLHVGIGHGSIWAARLGGVDARWHLLIAGNAVREASEAATGAPAGETVIGAAAGNQLERCAPAMPAAADEEPSTARGSPNVPSISDYVPRVVKEWTAEGYESWLGQVRNVFALIMRIDGLDSEQPGALGAYQEAVAAAMIAARPYTGAGGTLVFDDKGLVLKLCLGLPHDAHADDALRAARAGFAIERELHRLGLRCAAGLACGRGVCMLVGGSERQHYVAVGRFMHVAARLMQQTQEGLLCTAEVADHLREEFTLSPLGRLRLKGVQAAIDAFRVRDIEYVIERPERLFGREFEQKQLELQVRALENGNGRIVWLRGDAGIGKSALVRHLLKVSREHGLASLMGGAASVDTALPYLVWRPIFAALLQEEGAAGELHVQHRAQLRRLRHPQLAPLINAVLPGFMEETDAVRNLSGEARVDATTRVLSETLDLCAPKPLVLVLEDCHWMDSASLRLLVRVAQEHSGLLLVLTSRPSAQIRELDVLKRLEGFVELTLSPLRTDAVANLVQELLELEVANQDLVQEIVERSGCNPLFIREYARLLQSRERLARGPAPSHRALWPRLPEGGQSLPATVEGLIASRLDGLSPEDDLALKAASVLGDQFSTDLLGDIYPGGHRTSLPRILGRLVHDELLVETGTSGSSYAFRHALIRKGAYEQLTSSQRRSLHRAAAEAMEQRYAEQHVANVATLAHHWLRAECREKAVAYSDKAATQALAAGAYLEADRLLGVCMQLYGDQEVPADPAAIRWLRQMAEARRGTGQLEPRAAAAREALARAGRRRAKTRLGLTAQAAVRVCRLLARRSARGSRRDTTLRIELAQAYRHSAEVCYFNNDMIGMICDSISSVECAAAAPPSAVLASASTELGGVLAIAGWRRIGERILSHAIEVAAAAGDKAALAYAHLVSSLYGVGTGNWQGAERSARFCQDLCEPMDDAVNWTNAQAIRYWLAHYQGRLDAAETAARALQDRALETGNRQHQAWALRYLAQCELRRERPGEAVRCLTEALERLGETAALNERIPAVALLALAMLRTGETWAARARAREGLALMAQINRPIGHGALEGYSALTEVVLDAWSTEPAAADWPREAGRCLRVLRKYRSAFPIGEPRYRLWRGHCETLSGRHAAAKASFERCEAVSARLGMPWEAARCAQALSALRG